MCPLLQKLTDAEQEHNGASRIEIAAQKGNTDRRRIQHLHMQLALKYEAVDTFHDITDRLHGRVYRTDRRREKCLRRKAGQYLLNQLFFVLLIQGASAAFNCHLLFFGNLAIKRRYLYEYRLPILLIIDNRICCPLIHLSRRHAVQAKQILFQNVRFAHGMEFPGKADTDSSFDFMLYNEFHDSSSSGYRRAAARQHPMLSCGSPPLLFRFMYSWSCYYCSAFSASGAASVASAVSLKSSSSPKLS